MPSPPSKDAATAGGSPSGRPLLRPATRLTRLRTRSAVTAVHSSTHTRAAPGGTHGGRGRPTPALQEREGRAPAARLLKLCLSLLPQLLQLVGRHQGQQSLLQ